MENKDFVYNISFLSSNHPAAKKRKNELEDKFKVKMGPKEFEYLESQLSNTIGQKDPKKTLCYPQKCDIDQVWEQQDNKRESLDNYYSNQRKCNEKQFEIVSFDDSFLVCDNTDDSDYEGEESEIPKKRKFKKVMETSDDPLPPKYCHVRTSERKVLDKFYLAAGDLIGEGLSPREALLAIEIVSNRCFDRNFKQLVDSDKKYIMIKILYLILKWLE